MVMSGSLFNTQRHAVSYGLRAMRGSGASVGAAGHDVDLGQGGRRCLHGTSVDASRVQRQRSGGP
eukprot:4125423-Lingulodinium_polyedra.AAC.1